MPATLLGREPNVDRPMMGNVTDSSGISAGTILRVEPEGEEPFYTFAFGATLQPLYCAWPGFTHWAAWT